eukprot:1123100-Prymnesium_polylepis.1
MPHQTTIVTRTQHDSSSRIAISLRVYVGLVDQPVGPIPVHYRSATRPGSRGSARSGSSLTRVPVSSVRATCTPQGSRSFLASPQSRSQPPAPHTALHPTAAESCSWEPGARMKQDSSAIVQRDPSAQRDRGPPTAHGPRGIF